MSFEKPITPNDTTILRESFPTLPEDAYEVFERPPRIAERILLRPDNVSALFRHVSDARLRIQDEEIIMTRNFLDCAGHRFRIVALLGKGVFGSVYEAELSEDLPEQETRNLPDSLESEIVSLSERRDKTKKRLAIKFIIEKDSSGSRLQDVAKEAAAWSSHGGLIDVQVMISKKSERVFILALEKAPGKSLSQLIDEKAFNTPSPKLSLELMMAARSYIKQLISLTRRGWTSHRDIKPSNLMLGGSIARLIDLGLARTKKEDALHKQSPSNAVKGTPRYVSPPVVVGMFDPDADQYALGLSLAETLGSIKLDSYSGIKEIFDAIVDGTYLSSPPWEDDEKMKESFPDRFHLPTERRFVKWLNDRVLPGYRLTDYVQKRREQLALAKLKNQIVQKHAQKQQRSTNTSETDRPTQEQEEEKIVQDRLEVYTYLLRELSEITRDHLLFLRAKDLHATLKTKQALELSDDVSHLFMELSDALGAQDAEALRRIFSTPTYRPFLLNDYSPKKPLKNRALGL